MTTLQLPGGNRRSTQIAQYAAPQLRSEVLVAQSAKVDAVSGATYTSQGYLQSLQVALDAAKFACAPRQGCSIRRRAGRPR